MGFSGDNFLGEVDKLTDGRPYLAFFLGKMTKTIGKFAISTHNLGQL